MINFSDRKNFPNFSPFMSPDWKMIRLFIDSLKRMWLSMRNSEPAHILYLEPYVHIFSDAGRILLYNTATAASMECERSRDIDVVIRRLKAKGNVQSIEITGMELQKSQELKHFAAKIKEGYFGDLLPHSLLKKNPFHFVPNICIQKDIKRLKRVSPERKGTGLLTYVNEVFLFINSIPASANAGFPEAHKQFPYNLTNGTAGSILDVRTIHGFLSNLASSSLGRINILGGNIFKHPELPRILDYLNELDCRKKFYISLEHCLKEGDLDAVKGLRNSSLELLIRLPIDKSGFSRTRRWLQPSPHSYQFIVESEEDVDQVSKIVSEPQFNSYSFRPFYNGRNLDFFKEFVFLTKEDILNNGVSGQSVMARQALNPFNFGKLYILNDGSAYANLNRPRIGNIKTDSIQSLILKILEHEKSWTRTRKHVTPCKSCRFHALCPPISNYEYVLRRYNFCLLK